MSNEENAVLQKKHDFLKVMADHQNDTKNSEVKAAIEDLNKAWLTESKDKDEENKNCSSAPARSKLRYGDWKILSAPDFPDRIINPDAPGEHRFTLGRLSFSMFEPKSTICTLNSVRNVVEKIDEEFDTYNIVQSLTVHAANGVKLPATMEVCGKCFPKTDLRTGVIFEKGELMKCDEVDADDDLRQAWKTTFDGQYKKANEEKGYISRIFMGLFSMIVKLTLPTDDHARFEMKRPPHGWLDNLYLDKDMRITRGNKGTIVVVVKEEKQ